MPKYLGKLQRKEKKVNGKTMIRKSCLKKDIHRHQPEKDNWGTLRVLENHKQYRNGDCLFQSGHKRLSNTARSKLKTKKEDAFS